MARVFTFPTINLLSGAITIEIDLFDGTTSVNAQAYKYFSKVGKIVKQNDFQGGQFQAAKIDFEVEYDYNNLFSGTIYPSLVAGNKAVLLYKRNGYLKFVGALDEGSFNDDDWYASAADMSTTLRKVTFSARWFLDLMKNYQMCMDVGNIDQSLLVSSSQGLIAGNPYMIELAVSSGSSSTFGLIYYLTQNLLADFGITVKVEDSITDIGFLTNNYYDDDVNGAGMFAASPTNLAFNGMSLLSAIVIPIGTAWDGTTLTNRNNLFTPGSAPYSTKYDLLMGLIQAFGWLVNFKYIDASLSPPEIHLLLSSRIGGNAITPTVNVKKNGNTDMFLEMIDSIDISSAPNGTEYTQSKSGQYLVPFSFSTEFDLKDASYVPANLGQLCCPSCNLDGKSFNGTSYSIIKYLMDLTTDKILNPSFIANIAGWTIISGAWSWTNTQSYKPGDGSMQLTVTANGHNEVQYVLASPQTRSQIWALWFKLDFAPADGQVTITLSFYNGATLNQQRVFTFTALSFPVLPTDWRLLTSYFDIQSAFANAPGVLAFDRIDIDVYVNGVISPAFNIFFDEVHVYDGWNTLPKLLGRRTLDYFFNRGQRKNIRTVDGVQDINLGDNYVYRGNTYFTKKVEEDDTANETNIEAISYQ